MDNLALQTKVTEKEKSITSSKGLRKQTPEQVAQRSFFRRLAETWCRSPDLDYARFEQIESKRGKSQSMKNWL